MMRFMLSRIKFKGDPCDSGRKPPKSKAPVRFKKFSDIINKRLDKQEEFNKSFISGIYKLVKANNSKY